MDVLVLILLALSNADKGNGKPEVVKAVAEAAMDDANVRAANENLVMTPLKLIEWRQG